MPRSMVRAFVWFCVLSYLGIIAVLFTVHTANSAPDTPKLSPSGYPLPGVAPSSQRAVKRAERYHWYELTDEQDKALREALKGYHPKRPIMVLTATPDSLLLAEDFDSAFNDNGIKSRIEQASETVDGLHCTDIKLAVLIYSATHIPVVVDSEDTGPDDVYVLNFGRKVAKK